MSSGGVRHDERLFCALMKKITFMSRRRRLFVLAAGSPMPRPQSLALAGIGTCRRFASQSR